MSRRKRMMEGLDQDIRDFIERETRENIDRGMPPEEAHYAALRKFGNVTQAKEGAWKVWSVGWLEELWQDMRYGLRQLRRSPGFTAVAVLTLALGIGANAAIFRLIDAVRLRTLPVRNPNTLAIIHLNRNQCCIGIHYGTYAEFTYPLWQQVRQRQKAFSSVAAWNEDQFNLATGGEVDYVNAIWVSGEFFNVLGIEPFLGRLISPSDDRTGCAGGVDLSYAFWQGRYGGSPSVVGKTLTLNGHPFAIVGVTPPSFFGVSIGDRFDLAVPICAERIINTPYTLINGSDAREDWWLAIIGRLKPGWSLKRATAQLATIAPAALRETIPPQYDGGWMRRYLASRLDALPAANGFSDLRQYSSTPLWLLLGLSWLVLLIACANLANLMLARAGAREREIAVRIALGASRARMIRQLLSESALLAVVGAVGGGLLAALLSRFLISFMSTPNNPVFLDMPTDWRVLGFIAGLAILTTILFGLLPALRAGRVPPGSVMKAGGRGVTTGRKRFHLQRLLVASQVALSLVLLAGALLFARSLDNLMKRNLGFQQNGVLVANLDFTRLNLPVGRRNLFIRELLDRIRAVPGVATAAASDRSPVNGGSSNHEVLSKQGANEGYAICSPLARRTFGLWKRPPSLAAILTKTIR